MPTYEICSAYPKSTLDGGASGDMPAFSPTLRELTRVLNDTGGGEAPHRESERIANFATDVSTGVVYNAAPGFDLKPGTGVTFSADGLPKGVKIDPSSGRITGTVDRAAAAGMDDGTDIGASTGGGAGNVPHAAAGAIGGGAIYEVRITATDSAGSQTARYFQWTVGNIRPDAKHDFGATDAHGSVSGNVITGEGRGAELVNGLRAATYRPTAYGAGRDVDPDGDTLEVIAVAGYAANVGQSVTCPGGGRLSMDKNGDYSFRAPPASADEVLEDRPVLITPYVVRDSEGGVNAAALFLDQSNGASTAPVRFATPVATSTPATSAVQGVGAEAGQDVRPRVARATDDEAGDLRGLLDGSGRDDVSVWLSPLSPADASGDGIGDIGATPSFPASGFMAGTETAADVASALVAALLQVSSLNAATA